MPLPDIPEGPVRLENLVTPGCLLGQDAPMVALSLSLAGGKIVQSGGTPVDMRGAMVFPAFTDMHTHLDKGHIWPRTPNPDGTFEGALTAVRGDAAASWSAGDVGARMAFSLRCAYAHGTRAIRTHLDSGHGQDAISWPVFTQMRETWAGKIDLQGVSLVACDYAQEDGFQTTADIVAAAGGVLGMVTYPSPNLQAQLDAFFAAAEARGLDADFHTDETMDPSVNTLRAIAQTVLDRGFDRPVTVGHLCSLSSMPEKAALETLDLVAKAGLHVVSLPMCNLYLQDRHPGRTPRRRGITLVHEMAARGIKLAFASDNTRDPFYAYGDMDMIEVMREATRIGHLDHSRADWTRAFTGTPSEICGFSQQGLTPGQPADLVICNARDWTELFARPQSDRIVIRGGARIDTTLPDYRDLDEIVTQ